MFSVAVVYSEPAKMSEDTKDLPMEDTFWMIGLITDFGWGKKQS